MDSRAGTGRHIRIHSGTRQDGGTGSLRLQDLTRWFDRFAVEARPERDDSDLRREFDVAFYRQQNPHVGRVRVDALEHYLEAGWKQGADPAPWFSASEYLAAYADVREAGIDPFSHYIRHGRREGRTAGVRPEMPMSHGSDVDSSRVTDQDTAEAARIAKEIAPDFNTAFYLSRNPDVAKTGVDPVRHYATEGWREGRDPTESFSTRYYLESNPDVRDQGINPFWHYIVAGRDEGRLPVEPGGYKARILKELPPFAQTVELWRAHPGARRPICRGALAAELGAALRASTGRLLVGFTQDNHRKVVGGVQLCVAREEGAALAAGHCYLSLHPAQPLPCLAPVEEAEHLAVNISLNGDLLGTAPISEVTAAIREATPGGGARSLIVHSLLGHAPEAVASMARALEFSDAWFWLHDNFSICPSYALQRNGVSYCGAPSPNSQACFICVYGAERQRHLPRMRALLGSIDFTVVAPSQAEHDLWMARSGLPLSRAVVLPHLSLDWSAAEKRGEIRDGAPVRVAFAGIASAHKGWPVFRRLAEACTGDGNYSFHYFGVSETDSPTIDATPVKVEIERPEAMRDALMAADIDLLVHWASCPETFSFSACEALAAGSAIVTHPGTGNVAALVQEGASGAVLDDEEALLAFFLHSDARALAATNRRIAKRGAAFAFSRMTVDLIEGERADADPLLHELLV